MDSSTGLSACFMPPSRKEILEKWGIPNMDPYHVGLAAYDEDRKSCVPTHIVTKIREEAFEKCIELTEDQLFFPVALVKDYETMSIVSTWSSPELGLYFWFRDVLPVVHIFIFVVIFSNLCLDQREGKYTLERKGYRQQNKKRKRETSNFKRF
eukprot:TRINITY_DN884_c0_g1_i1.p4 TRINITY_DN884_c0_g1~~TRINITY_DN884_c0_g1_i1.p4  ORF type:complete len:153 (+),score=35.24 TRINITY_DN884_c0_g1_i1:2041-2499(+)